MLAIYIPDSSDITKEQDIHYITSYEFRYDMSHTWVLWPRMNEPQADIKKNRNVIIVLALLGALQPTPVPLAGVHKFYLGQYGWGLVYLLLGATQVPRVASAVEAIWYLVGSKVQMPKPASSGGTALGETIEAVALGLREIEQLRQEGLLSEHEFEQKRRSLLEQMP